MSNLTRRLFFWIALLTLFYAPPHWAAETEDCTASGCTYRVPLDRTGFYIAVVTLPPGQPEGVWSLLINPKQAGPLYSGSFFAGATLKENASFGSWVGFSLADTETVQIKPADYTGVNLPFTVELRLENNLPVYGPIQMTPGQAYTTSVLSPGFYVTSVLSQANAPDTFFGVDLTAPSIYGGVVGGWLDSKTGPGYAAFSVNYPQTVTFELMFDGLYGAGGAGQPHLEVYYQKADGTREVYWSSPRVDKSAEQDFIQPTMPPLLPEPAELPSDPGEAGKTALEGVDSDKDGLRDDVQRYIKSTYPSPEEKALRAALREYVALQQQFMANADNAIKTKRNADYSTTAIQCISYFRPDDAESLLLDIDVTLVNTKERSLAHIKADSQLSGQIFSLIPSERLPEVCSRFAEETNTRRGTVRADSTSSCKKQDVVVVFANGMFTEFEGAIRDSSELQKMVKAHLDADNKFKGQNWSFSLAYNPSESFKAQLIQVIGQRLTDVGVSMSSLSPDAHSSNAKRKKSGFGCCKSSARSICHSYNYDKNGYRFI